MPRFCVVTVWPTTSECTFRSRISSIPVPLSIMVSTTTAALSLPLPLTVRFADGA